MRLLLLFFGVFLSCLSNVFAQTNYYVFEPKLSESFKDGTIDFYFSGFAVNDSILVKNEKDELLFKYALNHTSRFQIMNVMRKVGNIKIYAHRANDGNPARTICFDIRGLLDKKTEHYCISKSKFLWIKTNLNDDSNEGSETIYFPLKSLETDSIRVDIRHDLSHGRKERTDTITVNGKLFEISTDGDRYSSKCRLVLANTPEIFLDILFKTNKLGNEKTLYLAVVVTALSTGERSSKTIRLHRDELVRYRLILKRKK